MYRDQVKNKRANKGIFDSKAFMLSIVALLLLLCFGVYKEITKRLRVYNEISALESEIDSLDNKNKDLSKLIEYFNTDSYIEREAREKLGLAKPGEEVIALPKSQSKRTLVNNISNSKDIGNSVLWWRYFTK